MTNERKKGFSKIFDLLEKLSAAKIHHGLTSYRSGYIAVQAVVPGQRWEIEISEDGEVIVEIFRSDGSILGEVELAELIARFSD